MRIAQISPLYESVPPHGYGGTERVVSYLTEELVRQGHQVTLFASGDSVTTAELAEACPRSLRLDPNCVDSLAPHLVMLEEVFRQAHRFDILHFHIDYLHFPFSKRQPQPRVTTLHGRLDLPELPALYGVYSQEPLISISDAQRRPLPGCNWQGTVYHGLPKDLHTYREQPGDYLAFLGRISPEKGLDKAIAIARGSGLPLRIAAKIDRADRDYYEEVIRPLLNDSGVEFIGEVGGPDKDDFLGHARALLFPINWPEPFGLVIIEALACGTPVIAFPCGSVPEILQDGLSGFVVGDVAEAVAAVQQINTLDRRRCRTVFEERFGVERMTGDYLTIYERLAVNRPGNGAARSAHYHELMRGPHEPERLVRKLRPKETPVL
jgi:glycosyltransferase involved in cell wall biosynthesis